MASTYPSKQDKRQIVRRVRPQIGPCQLREILVYPQAQNVGRYLTGIARDDLAGFASR